MINTNNKQSESEPDVSLILLKRGGWGVERSSGGVVGGRRGVFSSVVRHLWTPNVPEPTGALGPSGESRPVGARLREEGWGVGWGGWEGRGYGGGDGCGWGRGEGQRQEKLARVPPVGVSSVHSLWHRPLRHRLGPAPSVARWMEKCHV